LLLCLLHCRLDHFEGSNKVKSEMVKTGPAQEKVSYTTSALPGKTITLK
jgi:hypothetical protein